MKSYPVSFLKQLFFFTIIAVLLMNAFLSYPSAYAQEEIFNNSEWIIQKSNANIPESPYNISIDGIDYGSAKMTVFYNRVGRTTKYPQVFVLYSSGYVRIKAGADPALPLPFGQSIVLGPALFGTSDSFATSTLFFNPQIQQVSIDTSHLDSNGAGKLKITMSANDENLAATSTKTNQLMNIKWDVFLNEPFEELTEVEIVNDFTLTENVNIDSDRTNEFQSFRLLQISSMYLDEQSHEIDAFQYNGSSGFLRVDYDPSLFDTLLPKIPGALDINWTFESLHSDDVGIPNGNTPSYRIVLTDIKGPTAGPITPRAFISQTDNPSNDNLGVWLHQSPSTMSLSTGTRGSIQYTVFVTTDPYDKARDYAPNNIEPDSNNGDSSSGGCFTNVLLIRP
jgi:hypothetical protein